MILDFSLLASIDFGHFFGHIAQITPPIVPADASVSTPIVSEDAIWECVNTTTDTIALSCGDTLSTAQAENWDRMWNTKLGAASPEFISMLNISRYIAGPAIAYWFIYAIIKLRRNGLAEIWTDIVPVIMVASLLYTNNAQVPRQMILAMRSLMNYQNSQVIQLVNAANISDGMIGEAEDKYKEIVDFDLMYTALTEERAQCNGETRNTEMLVCLENANETANELIEKFVEEHGETRFTSKLREFVTNTINNPMDRLKAVLTAELTADDIEKLIGKVANPLISAAMGGIMAMTNQIAQYIVELSWLYTAIILPIPVSLAFYSGTRKIFIAWIVGFLTLGFFKLNLNIATSLVVAMSYSRGPSEPAFDVILLGFGVLVMAFGMTAMGGMAIMAGINAAIGGITLGVVNFVARGVKR